MRSDKPWQAGESRGRPVEQPAHSEQGKHQENRTQAVSRNRHIGGREIVPGFLDTYPDASHR